MMLNNCGDWGGQSYNATGTTRADAVQLVDDFFNISSVDAGGGVILQDDGCGCPGWYWGFNADATNAVKVYHYRANGVFNPDGINANYITLPPRSLIEVYAGTETLAFAKIVPLS